MNKYEIYDVPKYKSQIQYSNRVEGSIKEIVTELENKKNYHERILKDDILILHIDIDGCDNLNEIKESIIFFFKDEYGLIIEDDDIKYTENRKYGLLKGNNKKSYHITIPKYNGTSLKLKSLWNLFKERYKYKCIDHGHLGCGETGKWFRLPNQLKGVSDILTYEQSIGTEHDIINGKLKNFVLKYIPKNSVNIDHLIKEEKKIKEKTTKEERVIQNRVTKDLTLTDKQIKDLLKKLDKKFLNDYEEWFKITTLMKSLGKYKIWNKWSKGSEKYDQNGNNKIWNSAKLYFDENYLKYLCKLQEETYKSYDPLTKKIEFEVKKINSKHFNEGIEYDELKKYKTIILKSSTGTGKTTMVAEMIKEDLERDKSKRVLSVVSKISLSDQQIDSFYKKEFELVSYQNKKKDVKKDDIVCCINSLWMYQHLSNEEIKNMIIYIDEVNSLIEDLVDNDTLNKNLRVVYHTLMRLINNCHKVIVSDALISDNVINLLNKRSDKDKIMVVNEFRKYKGIKAEEIKDENMFLEKMKEHCLNNEYFLFGCDNKEKVTEFYEECLKCNIDKSKFILITVDHKIKIKDASELFKNKFVFYSPSIVYGVDFSIEFEQDVFIYITGKSLMPSGCFQQATRTRNIRTLYYYCNAHRIKENYFNLHAVKKNFRDIQKTNDIIKNVCIYYDEEDNYVMLENAFFEMYCYNEYVKDTYKTNIKKHFNLILEENGFILSSIGEYNKIEKEKIKEMKKEVKEEQIKKFEEFKKLNEESSEYYDNKYDNIKKNIKFLGLNEKDKDKLDKYKEEIIFSKQLENHIKTINFLKSYDYVKMKVKEEHENAFYVTIYNSSYNKIKYIKEMEQKYNIHFLNKDFNERNEEKIEMSEEEYRKMKILFRSEKEKPETYDDLKKIYAGLVKNITGNKLIETKRETKKDKDGKQNYNYSVNKKVLDYHLNLDLNKNKNHINLDSKIFNYLGF